MSDHSPECPMRPIAEGPVDFHRHFPDCICPALRACEARATEATDRAWQHHILPEVRAAAYLDGVQAARDAVAALRDPIGAFYTDTHNGGLDDALAAIDALTANADMQADVSERRQDRP